MYSAEKEKLTHQKILQFLKEHAKGLTMTELARGTKYSRKALEKHLQVLVMENEIYMKQFGVTKVYYPNHRLHHFDFERLDYNNKTIWFDILENEFGQYLLIQKKKKIGEEWLNEHSLTVPLEQGEAFLQLLEKILHSFRIQKLIKKL